MGPTSIPLFTCIAPDFRVSVVAAFLNKAIKGTKEVSLGDRQINCL